MGFFCYFGKLARLVCFLAGLARVWLGVEGGKHFPTGMLCRVEWGGYRYTRVSPSSLNLESRFPTGTPAISVMCDPTKGVVGFWV